MTKLEKILKNEASIDEIAKEFQNFVLEHSNIEPHTYENEMKEFLRAECKPTLTEEERVILRNIEFKDYIVIGRKESGDLYVNNQENDSFNGMWFIMFKKNLFQFIKERRRIFY